MTSLVLPEKRLPGMAVRRVLANVSSAAVMLGLPLKNVPGIVSSFEEANKPDTSDNTVLDASKLSGTVVSAEQYEKQ